jgi:putative membrane protein
VRRGAWLPFLVICFCLAFSAFYELIEWWTAVATGEAADAFLGTQGDRWDTQWDMCFALVGAITALVTLSYLHDRQLQRIDTSRQG